MTLRLTVTAREDLTVIRVDGRLAGDGVLQLEQACQAARRPVVLDLTHLATADDTGVVTLRRLAGDGAHLLGLTPYITLLLGAGGAGPEPPAGSERPGARPARRRPSEKQNG